MVFKLTVLVEEMDGCFVVHWLESNDAITPEGTITDECTDPWPNPYMYVIMMILKLQIKKK